KVLHTRLIGRRDPSNAEFLVDSATDERVQLLKAGMQIPRCGFAGTREGFPLRKGLFHRVFEGIDPCDQRAIIEDITSAGPLQKDLMFSHAHGIPQGVLGDAFSEGAAFDGSSSSGVAGSASCSRSTRA